MISTPCAEQIGPVVNVLRIALADEEDDRRRVRRAVVGSRDLPDRGQALAVDLDVSMSHASASVTTSALSPSMTARAWLPEPPCDICTETCWPVSASHFADELAR